MCRQLISVCGRNCCHVCHIVGGSSVYSPSWIVGRTISVRNHSDWLFSQAKWEEKQKQRDSLLISLVLVSIISPNECGLSLFFSLHLFTSAVFYFVARAMYEKHSNGSLQTFTHKLVAAQTWSNFCYYLNDERLFFGRAFKLGTS